MRPNPGTGQAPSRLDLRPGDVEREVHLLGHRHPFPRPLIPLDVQSSARQLPPVYRDVGVVPRRPVLLSSACLWCTQRATLSHLLAVSARVAEVQLTYERNSCAFCWACVHSAGDSLMPSTNWFVINFAISGRG